MSFTRSCNKKTVEEADGLSIGMFCFDYLEPYKSEVYSDGIEFTINESKVTTGTLSKVWKCKKGNKGPYPPWFKLNIDFGLWRNDTASLGSEDENTRASVKIRPSKKIDLDC